LGDITGAASRELSVSRQPADWTVIGTTWTVLAEADPRASFFVGIDWTAAWLDTFGRDLDVDALVFTAGARAVGICLLVSAVERRGPFRIRRMYVNTAGEPLLERNTIEFNTVLCLPGWEEAVLASLWAELRRRDWDECVAEGWTADGLLPALASAAPDDVAVAFAEEPSFHVDLDGLRRSGRSYEHVLSANTRAQIRRSLERYERRATVRIDLATDVASAEGLLDELIDRHQVTWHARGQPGAFAVPRKVAFHRALVRRGVARGTVHLLRVSAGDTIGVFYNFVHRGKVYFYQSGLQYESDTHLQPGLVSHYCAIQHYFRAGLSDYDFLAGDSRYKRSLSTGSRPLVWATFSRHSPRLAAIELLRRARRSCRSVLRRTEVP
jgi:CelD/BcsL family acetyltransferase involved in cellulose biosynthesis